MVATTDQGLKPYPP